ncbi:MAG TPA: hypothetical protein VMR00_18970 [Streptosporangiaceae bacterium]|nr:hypothetical protein [Streptosporangiaceae bacterium]
MTESHNEPGASGQRMTTGEFRAAPDLSASTAEFRAFAENRPEPATAQWGTAAPARSPARLALLAGGAVVVVAIIVILIATLG